MTAQRNELHAALEAIFRTPVREVRRRPSAYSSSFAIEELEVRIGDDTINVIFKDLSPDGVLHSAAGVKPDFLYDPLREINVYRRIHPFLKLGTPEFYGAVADESTGRYWLFLERISAPELYQIGDIEIWLDAARWLARFHASRASDPKTARATTPQLLEYDSSYYRRWLRRAQTLAGHTLNHVAHGYEGVIDYLAALPRTLIHGEFYASNILSGKGVGDRHICAVDWEMAAIGPGIFDVAALVSGRWNRKQRWRMVQAWHDALPQRLRLPDLATALDCAQLQTALQWLGWSDRWVPPQEHSQDWLAEALSIASQDNIQRLKLRVPARMKCTSYGG